MFLLFLWLPSWWCQDKMIRWYLKKYSSFVTLIRIQHSNHICSILNFETTHTHTHTLSPPFRRCFEHCYINTYNHLTVMICVVFIRWRIPIMEGFPRARRGQGLRLVVNSKKPTRTAQDEVRTKARLAGAGGERGETWLTWHKSWYSWKDFWTTKRWKTAKWRLFSEAPKSPAPKRFLEKVTSDLKCLPVAVYDKCCLDLLACSPSPMI